MKCLDSLEISKEVHVELFGSNSKLRTNSKLEDFHNNYVEVCEVSKDFKRLKRHFEDFITLRQALFGFLSFPP